MKCNNPSCQWCNRPETIDVNGSHIRRECHVDLFNVDRDLSFTPLRMADMERVANEKPFLVIPPAPKTIKPRVSVEAFKAIHSNKEQREAMMPRFVESSRSFADPTRPFMMHVARDHGKSHMTEFQRKLLEEVSKMKDPAMVDLPRKTGGFIIMDELGTVREKTKKETWFDKLFNRKTNKE